MSLAAVGVTALPVFVLASAAQAVTGFGFALVAVPLLAVVVDPVTAVVATTVASLVLTTFAAWRERGCVERPVAVRVTLAGLAGLPLGLLLLAGLDPRVLTVAIAIGLLLLVVLLAVRVRVPPTAAVGGGAGLLSGVLLAATGMNGPPVVVALQALDLSPRRFRATLQAIFCVQDLLAVAGFAALGTVGPPVAAAVAGAAVGVPAGWWLGDRLFGLLPAERFRQLVLTMLAGTALVAFVHVVA